MLALSGRVAGLGLDGFAAEYWGRHQRFGVFELPDNRRYWFLMRTQPVTALMPDRAACAAAEGWPLPISDAIAATPPDALIPFVVHAKPPPKTLCALGITRVGDAAHAMDPILARGPVRGWRMPLPFRRSSPRSHLRGWRPYTSACASSVCGCLCGNRRWDGSVFTGRDRCST